MSLLSKQKGYSLTFPKPFEIDLLNSFLLLSLAQALLACSAVTSPQLTLEKANLCPDSPSSNLVAFGAVRIQGFYNTRMGFVASNEELDFSMPSALGGGHAILEFADVKDSNRYHSEILSDGHFYFHLPAGEYQFFVIRLRNQSINLPVSFQVGGTSPTYIGNLRIKITNDRWIRGHLPAIIAVEDDYETYETALQTLGTKFDLGPCQPKKSLMTLSHAKSP